MGDLGGRYVSTQGPTSVEVRAGGSLVVVLVITALNLDTPPGLTLYGWRKHHELRLIHQQAPDPLVAHGLRVPSPSDR